MKSYENRASVIGAELCLWSEVSNKHTHHVKNWMRSSSMAEKLWNSNIKKVSNGVMRRMVAHQKLMNRRGIPTAPITLEECEIDTNHC